MSSESRYLLQSGVCYRVKSNWIKTICCIHRRGGGGGNDLQSAEESETVRSYADGKDETCYSMHLLAAVAVWVNVLVAR
jgi:hypothetical protein